MGIPAIKFCGLVHSPDVVAINEIMPQYVGFVFCEKSKRNVSPKEAANLREALDPKIKTVGVFVDAPIVLIQELFSQGIIDIAQLHGQETNTYIKELRKALAQDLVPAVGLHEQNAQGAYRSLDLTCRKEHSPQPVHPEGRPLREATSQPIRSARKARVGTDVRTRPASPPSPSPKMDIWKAFSVTGAVDICAANASAADLVLMDAGAGCGQTFDWSLLADMERPFALAGGLSAENVHFALVKCAAAGKYPAIVDVSSGIEISEVCACGRTQKSARRMRQFAEEVRRAGLI